MTMAEVRQNDRVRAFLRARIIFNNRNTSIDCVIKNISSNGAKIELSSVLSIPSEFDLEVPQKGRVYRAQMMWRDAGAIGVQFVEAPAVNSDALVARAERLERENKKLKSTIAILTKRLERLGQDVSSDD